MLCAMRGGRGARSWTSTVPRQASILALLSLVAGIELSCAQRSHAYSSSPPQPSAEAEDEAIRRDNSVEQHHPRFAHPYYWAAFIPAGDWTPLAANTLEPQVHGP